jgi:hypothetical protein
MERPDDVPDPALLRDAMAIANEMRRLAPCEIGFKPDSMLRLVGLLQLTLRHPNIGKSHREFVQSFIAHARAYFADCPAVLDVIRRGDDPRNDGPWR